MACDIGNSPLSASHFDDAWTKMEDSTPGLDAISDFNNNFDQQNSDTINPALTYSNPSTPQASNQSAYNFGTSSGVDLIQTLPPAPTYEAYPALFNAAPASPYFQSVEVSAGPVYQHSSLRNEQFGHRRSVSEPPGMPDQQPSMVFHRDEHWLGPAVRHKPSPLKSQHRHKPHRSHPYPASARAPPKYHAHPHSLPQGVNQSGFRPNLQRAYTQPARQFAPTSAPIMSPQNFVTTSSEHLQQANMHPRAPVPASPMPDNFPMQSTSRVCTPTPIDPLLSEPPTPSTSIGKRQTTLNIPMTVDELREMIFEAVQTAVNATGASKEVDTSKEVEEEGEKWKEFTQHDDEEAMPKPVQLEEVPDVDAGLGVGSGEADV